jgi:hypothetical protein
VFEFWWEEEFVFEFWWEEELAVLEFRRERELAFWLVREFEFWWERMFEFWRERMFEFWRERVFEYWRERMFEYWREKGVVRLEVNVWEVLAGLVEKEREGELRSERGIWYKEREGVREREMR